ncbi:helix-turn-helix domain-containing protein [Streptomyces luteireticuli]
MGRLPKALDPRDPLQAFAIELRALRDAAGAAGGQAATCEAVGINRSTYYAWLSGAQLPTSDLLELVVRAWGGDRAHWAERRRQTERALAQDRPDCELPTRETSNETDSPLSEIERLEFSIPWTEAIESAWMVLGPCTSGQKLESRLACHIFLSCLGLHGEEKWTTPMGAKVQLSRIRADVKRTAIEAGFSATPPSVLEITDSILEGLIRNHLIGVSGYDVAANGKLDPIFQIESWLLKATKWLPDSPERCLDLIREARLS